MDDIQFDVLMQMLEAIRLTIKGEVSAADILVREPLMKANDRAQRAREAAKTRKRYVARIMGAEEK